MAIQDVYRGAAVKGLKRGTVKKRRYLWFQNKRIYFAGQELNDIRREKGLGPVPLDGYVPGIDCPDKMKNWFD